MRALSLTARRVQPTLRLRAQTILVRTFPTVNIQEEGKRCEEKAKEAAIPDPNPYSHTNPVPSTYSKDVDIERLRNSLLRVNNFSKKKPTENPMLFYEIMDSGVNEFKRLSLRDLLAYVTEESRRIDDASLPPTQKIKTAVKSTFSSFFINEEERQEVRDEEQRRSRDTVPKDSNGKPTDDNSEFDTGSEISLRDLHRLDYLFNLNEEKSVLIRRHIVLFAMDPIRAVVMADRILIITPAENDPIVGILAQFMREWTTHHQIENSRDVIGDDVTIVPDEYVALLPAFKPKDPMNVGFEQHAYEGLFAVIKSLEFQEYDRVKVDVKLIMEHFESGALLPINMQEMMRELKNTLSRMIARVSSSLRLLKTITGDDDDLALMNLTLLRKRPHLYSYPLSKDIMCRKDVSEEILDSYLADFSSLLSKLEYLRSQVQTGEELVMLRLDTSRNQLLIANAMMSIAACAIGFSAYLSSLFGMSLAYPDYLVPYTEYIFLGVSGVTFVLIPMLISGTYRHMVRRNVIPVRTGKRRKTWKEFVESKSGSN